MIRRQLDIGIDCPCCDQFCKRYERQIFSTIAIALISLYRLTRRFPDEEWFHVVRVYEEARQFNVPIHGGELAKTAGWGLIDERNKDADDDTRRTSGFWKLTEAGKLFVEGKSRVPKYAYSYNNVVEKFSDETVTISDCLKKRFNYSELMAS